MASSSRVAVQPVGLDGELMKMPRVRGVMASVEALEIELPALLGEDLSAPSPAWRRRRPMAAAKFGQAGVGTITSSPAPAIMRTAIWIGVHAAMGDEEALGRERLAEEAGVIARERLAQIGNAALLGVEGLAGRERARRGLA